MLISITIFHVRLGSEMLLQYCYLTVLSVCASVRVCKCESVYNVAKSGWWYMGEQRGGVGEKVGARTGE